MTTDPTIWRTATERAGRQPESPMPCPGCGTQVKGANLEGHVVRVHPVAGPASPWLVGVDRRIHRAYGVLAGLGLVVVAGLLVAFPDRTPPADTAPGDALAAIGRSPALVAIVVGVVLLALVAIVHRVRPPQASVAVVDGTVTLRHRLGTGRLRVAGPLSVETGSLVRRVPSGTTGSAGSETSFPADDVHAGTYIRVTGRGRAVTVGCTSSTRVRKHWAGWTSGTTRRWWDLTLSPADFVALQYALAATGALAVPGASGPVRAGGR